MGITYLRGDATDPQASGIQIIAHICNDVGGWGKGFVLALSRRWSEPEQCYRAWFRSKDRFELGEVQFVPVGESLEVANMIAQRDIVPGSEGPPIRYDALEKCLEKVAGHAAANSASVHMPRIGCGLAGGTWDKVEPIILKTLVASGVAVFVYDR